MPSSPAPTPPADDDHRLTVDLNSDVGEGSPYDAAVIPLVTSINVACGSHAGDRATMLAAVRLAREHGVAVGAHPGHADREGFGRREQAITPADVVRLVHGQIAALADVAGDLLGHVKLHGALYHQVSRDPVLAQAVVTGLARDWPGLALVLPAGSPAVAIARHAGLTVFEEAFLDRGYADDGMLVPRHAPGSMIDDVGLAAARAVRIICEGLVRSQHGLDLPLRADTLCVHGDGSNPTVLLHATREALNRAGIHIQHPRASPH